MQTVLWLTVVIAGVATYIIRKIVQVALTGALYPVWAGPYPPNIQAPTPLQEIQLHLQTWWHYLSWQEWLTMTAYGAFVGVLLHVRQRNEASRLARSVWVIPVLALVVVYIDFPIHQWLQRTSIVWLGFSLLMTLVFGINLIWIGLLERLILTLGRRIPEWLS